MVRVTAFSPGADASWPTDPVSSFAIARHVTPQNKSIPRLLMWLGTATWFIPVSGVGSDLNAGAEPVKEGATPPLWQKREYVMDMWTMGNI